MYFKTHKFTADFYIGHHKRENFLDKLPFKRPHRVKGIVSRKFDMLLLVPLDR
jgi:hypothetical protein